jgi:hypothetical protein
MQDLSDVPQTTFQVRKRKCTGRHLIKLEISFVVFEMSVSDFGCHARVWLTLEVLQSAIDLCNVIG